jgi:hypothetical protein
MSLLTSAERDPNRHELAVEVLSASKGTSLVTDNVKQRRAALKAKLAVHAQARSFYMPAFNPARLAADSDLDLAPEKTPLHLPSSLSSKAREKFCRPGLIDAEIELRRNAMEDVLADLIRHLQARTFVLRFKVRNVTGVRANTRIQDGIAGISRRVDTSAAAYRRHRKAYKQLVGPGPTGWEAQYKPLTSSDVRGLSEKAVTAYELQERSRVLELSQALANVIQSDSQVTAAQLLAAKANLDLAAANASAAMDADDLSDDDDIQPDPIEMASNRLAEAVGPGEGTRKVSWIWLAGLDRGDLDDPHLSDGECHACGREQSSADT